MKMVDIKYKCLHPSCVVNCREGFITLDQETYSRLKAYYEDDSTFRSPKGICRMGFNQPFKAVTVEAVAESDVQVNEAQHGASSLSIENDPVAILMAEHQQVLKTLGVIEEQMRKRDINALWVSTAELENEIMLHSVRQEEDVLFPLLSDLLPLGEGLVSIVKEDHRELMTLMHSFRSGLADGEILDGLGLSILVNLKSHIRKEDSEFFELIDKALTDDLRKTLIEGFKKVKQSFVPLVADERSRELARQSALVKNRDKFDDEIQAAKEAARDSAGGCCH